MGRPREQGANVLTRLRYRYLPDHLIGEILTKRWIDNAIPFLVLVVAMAVFGILLPGFFSLNGLSDLGRQFAEFGLIVLGLTIVMISGGIDLSVASVFTLAVLLSLIGANVEGWPVGLVSSPSWRWASSAVRSTAFCRLSAASGVPDHAGHAHHLPLDLRYRLLADVDRYHLEPF